MLFFFKVQSAYSVFFQSLYSTLYHLMTAIFLEKNDNVTFTLSDGLIFEALQGADLLDCISSINDHINMSYK